MLDTVAPAKKISKKDYRAEADALRVELINLQYDLARSDGTVLVLLGGDDRLAVEDLAELLNEWMDTRYLPTYSFSRRNEEERRFPPAWRFWKTLPGAGEIALIELLDLPSAITGLLSGRLDEASFETEVRRATAFERTLSADGTTVLKLWLHLPATSVAARLEEAANDPEVSSRLSERDRLLLRRRDQLDDALNRYLREADAGGPPWRLVASNNDRHRNLTVARAVRDAMVTAIDGAGLREDRSQTAASSSVPVERATPAPSALAEVDLTSTVDYDTYTEAIAECQLRLRRLAEVATELGIPTVAVFEGWDAAGKGGVIRRIHRALRSGTYQVVPIAAPTDVELAHHYLWRFWQQLPPQGQITVFDRSWYGRVLVERVEGFATEDEWRRAYHEIRDFEEQLVDFGAVMTKFWLHIDPEEQLRRFEAREDTPYKKYKITDEDYRNRDRWPDYVVAVDDMVAATSTADAPWTLVPANDKRFARLHVLQVLTDAIDAAITRRL